LPARNRQLDAALAGLLADMPGDGVVGAGVVDGDGVVDGAGGGCVVLGVGTAPSLGPAGFLSQATRPLAAIAASTTHDSVLFMMTPSLAGSFSVPGAQLADLLRGFVAPRAMGAVRFRRAGIALGDVVVDVVRFVGDVVPLLALVGIVVLQRLAVRMLRVIAVHDRSRLRG
jgi:hypothetical protein